MSYGCHKIYHFSQAGEPLTIPPLDRFVVIGIDGPPTKAYYNGEAIQDFSFNTDDQVLVLANFKADLNSNFKITWE